MKHSLAGLAMFTLISAPVAASAQAVSGDAASAALFDPKGRTVSVVPNPLPGQSEQVTAMLVDVLKSSAASVRYYGSIAMAPDAGLESEATAQSENFHSVAAADAAALANCNARRSGGAPCVIVARTLPKGYEPRPLELSVDATEAFATEYRKAKTPKALAISPSTGGGPSPRGRGRRRPRSRRATPRPPRSERRIAPRP